VWPVFDDLVDLRCQLVTKYRGQADRTHEGARLRTMVEVVAGGHPTLLLATAEDTPVGFALFAPNRDEWLCLAVGHDYADPRSRLTYFGAAYYRAAEAAYATGVHTIGYGQGSWQAKRARGCRPTPLAGWVHSTDPALAAAVRASAAMTELVSLD
jgi:predicted N-acyltransferase